MRIKTIEQLYQFCDDIFLSKSIIDIVKFENNQRIKISKKVDNFIRLVQDDYLMKVLVSAFKENNVLDLSFGASFEKFTIILHMDLCFDIVD